MVNNRELGYIAVKILSINIFIRSSKLLINLIENCIIPIVSGRESCVNVYSIISYGGVFAILFTFGIILWVFTDKICNHIVVNKQDIKKELNYIRIRNIQALVFSIVGLFISIKSISGIIAIIPKANYIFFLYTKKQTIGIKYQIVKNVLGLMLGFSLFFGANGLIGILIKLRSLGIKKKVH